LPGRAWSDAFDDASTSVVKGKQIPDLSGSLQITGGHFARFGVALHIVTNFLTFNDFVHASAFDGGDMDEGVRTAVVRLDKAEAFGGIEPFNCASGHDEPFHSIEREASEQRARR
jgi:hypothetical protein